MANTHTHMYCEKKEEKTSLSLVKIGRTWHLHFACSCFFFQCTTGVLHKYHVDEEEEGDGISISERRKVNK